MPEALISGVIDFESHGTPTLIQGGTRVSGAGLDIRVRLPANVI